VAWASELQAVLARIREGYVIRNITVCFMVSGDNVQTIKEQKL